MKPMVLVVFLILILPTVVSAQELTSDLCVRDFVDTNQNSVFDAGEPSYSGVNVFVRNIEGDIIGSLTTTLDEDCLRTLAPDTYEVEFRGTFQATTPTLVTVAVGETPIFVELGVVPPSVGGNEICVLVFNDTNTNSIQDEDEVIVGGIDVNLTIDGVIIATLITNNQEYSCFTGLSAGAYRVIIPETPRHLPTTRTDFAPTFIDIGNRVDADFGAVLLDPFTEEAVLPDYGNTENDISLDQNTRLLLAIFGATIVMLFVIGCGVIVIGIVRR